MDVRDMTIVSYNGLTLNNSNYLTRIPMDAPIQGGGTIVEIQRGENPPVYTGKVFGGRIIPLMINVQPGGAGSVDELMEYFDPYDTEPHDFIVKDTADSDKQWYVEGVTDPASPPVLTGDLLNVSLYVANPIWKVVSSNSSTWYVTGTGQTKNVTIGGNKSVNVTFDITPTTARGGGYGYKRYVAIAGNTTSAYNDPVDVTDGGLDTATLVSGGKMQADGDDLRIIDDNTGQEVMRWFGDDGINGASTTVWINAYVPAGTSVTLGTAIASSGAITTITLENTILGEQYCRGLAAQSYKVVQIDDEIFTYTGTNPSAYQLTGVTRAQKGSSEAAHTTSDTVRLVSGYWMVYGNSAVSAPAQDSAYQPMFDLTNSTNASRVYANYYDSDNPTRAGQWRSKIIYNQGNTGGVYTANHMTTADPAQEMGITLRSYTVSGIDRTALQKVCWYFTHPARISSVATSGETYRSDTSFPAVAGLRWMSNAGVFTNLDNSLYQVWNESSPGSEDTWTAFSHNAAAGAVSDVVGVAFLLAGTIAAGDGYASMEVDSITVALSSTYIPDITFGAEIQSNHADFRITNTTTGEWIEVHSPCAVNDSIIIDTDALEAYLESDGSIVPVLLDDENRAEWLALEPGTNTLQYDETGVVAVTIIITWYDSSV